MSSKDKRKFEKFTQENKHSQPISSSRDKLQTPNNIFSVFFLDKYTWNGFIYIDIYLYMQN